MKYIVLIIAFMLVACDNYQTVQKPENDDIVTDDIAADIDDLVTDSLDEPDGGTDEDSVVADTEAPDTILDEPDEIIPDDAPCVDGVTQCAEDNKSLDLCYLGVWATYGCLEQCKGLGYTQTVGCGYSSNAEKDVCFCE